MSNHLYVKKLVICALLIAVGVVLSGLLSIPAMPLGSYTLKLGFGTLPTIIASVLYGPLYGGMVGGVVDLLQALIFPKGGYVPWFTIIGILFGVIPGLFFMKKQRPAFLRLLVAIGISQIIGSVILNTGLLSLLYGYPYFATMVARAINQAVMIPIYTVLTFYIMKALRKSGAVNERFLD